MKKAKRFKIIFLAVFIAAVAVFQYLTEIDKHTYHMLYQGLFFLPVMLAGFWFGLRSALITSLSITAILIPFTFIHWKGLSLGDINNVVELILYNLAAVILGNLKNRDQREQKRSQEAEKLAAVGKAVSALVHDLRTPLIAIGGLSRSMLKSLGENDPLEKKLHLVAEEAQRLEKMVTDMLDFSKPLELNLVREDVMDALHQSIEIVTEAARKKTVALEIKSSGKLSALTCDCQRMKQVFINLLMNAIEASPEGETVTVHTYRKRRRFIVDVTDRGSGVPPDRRDEIFSPFFTTKKGGTGLGLPIVKKIIDAHCGRIEVLDNSDRGLTFRMSIPVLRD
jgi:two-component system sensor histidine kinase HydH